MAVVTSSAVMALLRVVVTAAMLVLAFLGFLQAYPAGPDGRTTGGYVDILYRAVQLCVGRFPDELQGTRLPLALQIARIGLPLAAALAALSLTWEKSRNTVRQHWFRIQRDHLVVYGDGVLAQGLAASERRRKGPVLAWVESARGVAAQELEALGAGVIAAGRGALDLKKLGLEKARAFIAAGEGDAANLEVAKRVLDHAARTRSEGEPLEVIARIDDTGLHGALDGRFDRRDQRRRVHLRLASVPQLTARRFFLDHPVDRFRPEAGGFGLLVWIGWSPVAERMLIRVLASVHLRGGALPQLLVLDDDPARVEAGFRARWPGAREIAPVRFEPLAGEAPQPVAAQVCARRPELGAVYVTLPESSRALSMALALETALERDGSVAPPVYLHLPEAGAGAELVASSAVISFGGLSSLADPEALLQERHDEVARSIHEVYLEGRLAEGEALGDRISLAEWEELPEAVRDDNRLVADCYRVKLRELGARIVEGPGAQMRLTFAEVEELSRGEHDRWAAAKLLDGWVHGEQRDDRARLHPDLIPYDDLTEARKDLDREQVKVIPRILAASRRRAIRDFTVLLQGAPSGSDRGGEALAALAGLAQSHPDRAVVVLGDFADVGARRVLHAAMAAGYPVALVLTGPVLRLFDELGDQERRSACELYTRADRLIACPRRTWDERRTRELLLSSSHATLDLARGAQLSLRTNAFTETVEPAPAA